MPNLQVKRDESNNQVSNLKKDNCYNTHCTFIILHPVPQRVYALIPLVLNLTLTLMERLSRHYLIFVAGYYQAVFSESMVRRFPLPLQTI